MSAEALFRQSLLADAGVSALLTRLYEVQLPQNVAFPAAAFQRISTIPKYSHAPEDGTKRKLLQLIRFQVSIWAGGANGGALTNTIADAVVSALNTFDMSKPPSSPAVLINSPNLLINRRMGVEPQTQPPLYFTRLDIGSWYLEGQ